MIKKLLILIICLLINHIKIFKFDKQEVPKKMNILHINLSHSFSFTLKLKL